MTVIKPVSLPVEYVSGSITQIPSECSKPPTSLEASVCLFLTASLRASPHLPLSPHSLHEWNMLRKAEMVWNWTLSLCSGSATTQHLSLCSRLIGCFSQTQRLVPLLVTPWCGWYVCVCILTRKGLKTGLVSSGSKPEQIDRNKVLWDSKWSYWPHV